MSATKLAWQGPSHFKMRWFTNLSPDRIDAGGAYSWSNVRLVCVACQLMRDDLAVPVWQDNLRWLVEAPMPEVRGGFLVTQPNGLESYEQEWRHSAQREANRHFNFLQAIETGGQTRLAAWEEGQDRVRQTPRPKVVRNELTREEIAGELLKVMLSPYSFRDVTGLEVALSCASVDRLDPRGHHTLYASHVR